MVTEKRKKEVNESFSENALKMMRKRYLVHDAKGKQEMPADMFMRVAKALAAVEKDYGKSSQSIKKTEKDFFEIMASKEYTPAGRTMTNAGSSTPLIANCIVLPVADSMEDIFQTLKEAALLQQAGSGLGFAFDRLRPSMSLTVKSRGSSSGPVSFLKIYNEAFGIIKQQGRHGANMAMMGIDHPDVLDFLRSKEVEGAIRNFNISVKVTDEFMKKLVESPDEQWYCTWKGKKVKPHRVLRHANGSVYGSEEIDITAGEIFDEIVHYAWTNGEPGIVFIDTVNRTNPLPGLGMIEASNPCAEQFLHPYDNCNLGSINLDVFVKSGKVDYKRLAETTKIAVRLMDNVIDRFDFPVPQVTELAKKNRRIGLGIMGFADMLYQLGIKYNSERGLKTAEKMMGTIQKAAHEMSQQLAKEKGAFPHWKQSVFAKKKIKMRNAALTTVAPTGSISMMFDTSSGVEPNFALAYIKQDKDGVQYSYFNRHFEAALTKHNFSEEEREKLKEEVIRTGTIQHLAYLPQELRDTFVVSMDMSGEDHVRMQASFQRHVDNSISKTINFPNSATKEDVKQSYIMAWERGCKSCTVYRDGSRLIQILNVGEADKITSTVEDPSKKVKAKEVEVVEGNNGKFRPRSRPEGVLLGATYKIKTGYGNLYITVNDGHDNQPLEVFATIGKSGGFFQEQSEAICRMVSLSLRAGISVNEVIDQLKGIRGPMPIMTAKGTVLSLPDAVAQVLEEHLERKRGGDKVEVKEEVLVVAPKQVAAGTKQIADFGYMPECPDCGASLIMAEGCINCPSCGYNRCM
ncbi:MAG: adenosylcobalamin-dependent ribonucleoside-diphosphate reductase [Candidatus Colwellbacteria bacterium]|nr:adenosylcobalamin-dependent ribonucleoside-diphosphate reductase [Candidatus Colwellbacteria bacterium]